jgi:hypothetical protein
MLLLAASYAISVVRPDGWLDGDSWLQAGVGGLAAAGVLDATMLVVPHKKVTPRAAAQNLFPRVDDIRA